MRKDLLYILLLIGLSIVVYRTWISFSAFVFADWVFAFRSVLVDYIFPQTGGAFGFNIVLWKYPFYLLVGSIAYLGYDYNVVEKVLVFWPLILITPVASYYFVKKITQSSVAGVVGSLIYSYNTYFLSINTQGHELLPLAFSWSLFPILSYMSLLETKKSYFIPLTALLLFIVGSIDLRSLYIVILVIGLIGLFHQIIDEKTLKKNLAKNAFYSLLVMILLTLMNIYWVIPFANVQSLSDNEIFQRQLFGGEFYNIQNSLALFYPFWSGKEPTWLYLQKIPIMFWFFPILAFVGVIVSKRKGYIVLFGILSLIGIFLSKQESSPFPQVYPWLYQNLPGFGAFREASKFNYLIVIGYAVLIGAFADYVYKVDKLSIRIKYSILVLIVLLPIWNTIPYLTGEIKTLFVPKSVPHDFKIINDYLLRDPEYTKVFAINHNVYWAYSTVVHPVTDASHSLQNYWRDTGIYDLNSTKPNGEKIINFLYSPEGKRLLSATSFGYIVVPISEKQSNNNIRRDLGKNRQYFEERLGSLPYLTREYIDVDSILVYKNRLTKPLLYTTAESESLKKDIDFQRIKFNVVNPTTFRVNISHLTRPQYLNFTNLYHPEWRVYLGNFSWYTLLFSQENVLPEKFHTKNAMNVNAYLLDPDYIKKNFQDSFYKLNKDGSIDIELTVYLRPQSYLYLGLVISTVTFLVCITATIYLWRKYGKS